MNKTLSRFGDPGASATGAAAGAAEQAASARAPVRQVRNTVGSPRGGTYSVSLPAGRGATAFLPPGRPTAVLRPIVIVVSFPPPRREVAVSSNLLSGGVAAPAIEYRSAPRYRILQRCFTRPPGVTP